MTLEQLKNNIAGNTSEKTLKLLEEYFTENNWEELLTEGFLEIIIKQHNISNGCDDELEICISWYTSEDEFEFENFNISKKVIQEFTWDIGEDEFTEENNQ